VKTVGKFLARQGDGPPKRHGLIVGLNALVMNLGILIFVVALGPLILGFVRTDESLVKPFFIAMAVGLFMYLITFQRYLYYRGK
jgi:hypothetical protein